MTRHIPAVFAAASLAISAIPAQAQTLGVRVEGQVVVFDARTSTFIGKPKLDATKPVKLLIRNMNTFREKYEVTVKRVNFINADMPNALNNLFVFKAPGPPPAGAGSPDPAAVPMAIPPGIRVKITQFEALIRALNPRLRAEAQHTKEEILQVMRRGMTNEEVRRNVVHLLHQWYDPNNAVGGAVLALVGQNIGPQDTDNIPAFSDPGVAAARNGILGLIQTLRGVITDAKTALDLGREILADLRAANINLSMDATAQAMNNAVTELNTVITELDKKQAEFQYLYDLILNPKIVPTARVIENPTDADYIELTVKVTQVTFPLFKPQDAPAGQLPFPGQAVQQTAVDNRLNEQTFTYSASIYNRFVRDFSLGYVQSTLKKKNYFIAEKEDSTDKGIFDSLSDSQDGRWGAFAHFYPTTNLPFGLSLGPCIGIMPGDKTRYLLGGSAVIQPNRRFRIYVSYGAAYGSVELLAGGSSVSDGGFKPLDPTQALKRPQYETVSRWGHFSAVSFNFSF